MDRSGEHRLSLPERCNVVELQKTPIAVMLILWLVTGCAPADESDRPSTTEVASAGRCEATENVFERIECYVEFATDNDDPSVCGQSTDEGVKYQCYAIVAERRDSVELCNVIPSRSQDHQALKDICISDVAKKIVNALLCEQIQTVGLRDSCYAQIGRDTEDESLCSKIQDPGLRSVCSGKPVIVK